jgi:hypothetical protein
VISRPFDEAQDKLRRNLSFYVVENARSLTPFEMTNWRQDELSHSLAAARNSASAQINREIEERFLPSVEMTKPGV